MYSGSLSLSLIAFCVKFQNFSITHLLSFWQLLPDLTPHAHLHILHFHVYALSSEASLLLSPLADISANS